MPPRYQHIPSLSDAPRLARRAEHVQHGGKSASTNTNQHLKAKKVTQANLESNHPTNKSIAHDAHFSDGHTPKKFIADETTTYDVPIPIPDTVTVHHSAGTTAAHSKGASEAPHFTSDSLSSYFLSTATVLSKLASPSVLSLQATTTTTSINAHLPSSQPSYSVLPANPTHSASPASPHLSTLAISLLASGSACLIISIIIFVKVCTRPRRRTPTPSLPILTEGFDDAYKTPLDDSPLFGGEDRTSHQDFVWPQYPKPTQLRVEPSVQTRSRGLNTTTDGYPWDRKLSGHDYVFPRPNLADACRPNIASPMPIRHIQGAITHAARRLSTVSPSENAEKTSYDTLALATAISGPPLTADGHQVMDRTTARNSHHKSVNGDPSTQHRRSLCLRHSQQGLAYDGAAVLSPYGTGVAESLCGAPMGIAIASPAHSGRSRIKSSYVAGYRRTSTAIVPPSTSTTDFMFSDSSAAPLQRSESHRNRNTRALTAALGLGSPSPICPPPPSPQPIVYPDDSLSMTSSRRISKKAFLDRAADGDKRPIPTLSPTLDASSVLGNLMLMDFSPSKCHPSGDECQSFIDGKVPASTSRRNLYHDRPPRVPSPPPLPSLAQMGLERTCPEAFANYRSPTYSIFGLYEDNRKKRVSVRQ